MCTNFFSEHVRAGKPSLEVGGRLSAGEPRGRKTQPDTAGSRVADKFADIGHGHNEATGVFEEIQREFRIVSARQY